MAKVAPSEELRTAFENHLQETQNQVDRLEQIFTMLDVKGTGKKCAAMSGLIKESDEIVSSTNDSAVRDAVLIAAAQKVEHYEISGYGWRARPHQKPVRPARLRHAIKSSRRQKYPASRTA
jgi:ferritin-like metal-binding protein YciE